MKVLVLGNGGREHALAWVLRRELGETEVFLHPGNAGTARQGIPTFGSLPLTDRAGLVRESKQKGIELVVIGPEVLLAEGYADTFREKGFAVLGPGQNGARLESSKVFSKEFMQRAGVPTAPFHVARSLEEMRARTGRTFPVVLKLDGLAAGKGVVIAQTASDVESFAQRIWDQNEFGAGPHEVLIEEFLPGREISYIGVCDGNQFIAFPSATDFKRIDDNDQGPNTGGMGAISPSPYFNADLEAKVRARILMPVLRQLTIEKIPYRGVLYVGLMISPEGDPYVLEFNARFGDPETQAIVLRAESGFAELLAAAARGQLERVAPVRWSDRLSLYVVASAAGYPGKPRAGDAIAGLDTLPPGMEVFFSGVSKQGEALATNGGRVLGLGVLANSAQEARDRVYAALEKVRWDGMHFRRDIGLPRS